MQSQNPSDAAAEDVDNDAARRILRNVVLGAPSKLLVSVLAEELTDAQLEELIGKRRKVQREHVEVPDPEAEENPIRDVKTERDSESEQEGGSNPEIKQKSIKQERVVTSSDEEVMGIDAEPEGGKPASNYDDDDDDDDDEEEEFRPRRKTKRRNSRIRESDESEEEAETDKDEEPLHRALSSTKWLPSLTSSVRKLRRRSSKLKEPEVSLSEESDEPELSNREPLRRTRSATNSLPSDSPSARMLALRRLKEAKAKRQLSYGDDESAGGGRGSKAARFESSSNSGTDVESSGDADDLPDLPTDDDGSWGSDEDDGETDVEIDDMSGEEESEDSADSEDASGDDGSGSDDFATSMAKITGNLSRRSRKYQEATERYHEASFKKSPSSKSKRGKEEEKVVVHERLMRRLRRKASRPNLSDAEILDEMALYATAKDDECGGKCLCGKEGLKFLFFMHNKNVADPVKRTLGHKFIVGSECINAFHRAQLSRGGSPLVLFDNLVRKGATAFFRKETDSNGDYVFTITGQNGRYIADQRDIIAESYRLPLMIVERRNDAGRETTVVNIRVRRAGQRLERDKKYKIFLRPRFSRPRDRGPYKVTFDLERAEEPRDSNSTKAKDRPPSAKDFLK